MSTSFETRPIFNDFRTIRKGVINIDSLREFSYRILIYVFSRFPFLNKLAIELRLRVSMGRWRKEIKQSFENIDKNGVPLFYRVEFETLNRCNGTCSFCPVNKNDEKRPLAKMTEELFQKIINELHNLNYSGILSLFCNNEPFLDMRLERFAEIAREKLPNARIEVFTNGTVLKLERFLKIIPNIDFLVIDNYNDDLKWHEPIIIIRNYIKKNPEYKQKVKIRMRKQSAYMSTRAGQAPNNSKKKTLPVACLLPFYHLVIRPDGKVSLCCNDAYGKHTLGDVTMQSLEEVWFGEGFSQIREEIREGRSAIKLCKYCDSYANTAMLHKK